MKKTIILFTILLGVSITYSQQRVSGIITDNNKMPLPGVNVLVEGTEKGTVSDFDGKYTIDVNPKQILIFSYIGFKTQKIEVTRDTDMLNVTMSEDANELEQVVVTALGIKKKQKALGYAVQEVKGENFKKAKEANFVNSLSGRVAGLTIKKSTDLFQDSDIDLRGSKPLIVIDGIPDRTADIWKINSDDIESISVLKGATASALYGSVGRDGAIMITTKKGNEGKLAISFNNSSMFQLSFLVKPEVQTTYGNGNKGVYEYIDGSGKGTEGGGWIWGPKLNQLDPTTPSGYVEVIQYNSKVDPATGKKIPLPYISRGKNNITDFFQMGLIQSNNLSMEWGNKNGNFRSSISNIYQQGIVPNTDLYNISYNLSGGLNITDKFEIQSSLTYNKQYSDNFPEVGYGPTNYLYNLILWTGVDVDIKDLRNYWQEGKEGYQQKHFNNSYYNNPYFQAYEYIRGYDKNNIFGNILTNYHINDNLSLKFRSGINTYSLVRDFKEPKSYIGYGHKSKGNYTLQKTNYFDITTEMGLKYKRKISNNFELDGEIAYSNYTRNYNYSSTKTDGLNVPNVYNLSNNAGKSLFGDNIQEKEAINSLYGFLDMSFYNILYLTLTGRNDKTSTLPLENNSFFYPSISGSLVLSSMMDMPHWISFSKIRGSWSRVSDGKIGNDTYAHIKTYDKGISWAGTPSIYLGNTLLDPNLRPATSDSWEVGLDMRFLNNRLNLDVAYYQSKDYNNLIYIPLSKSTGYNNYLTNSNVYLRKGIELTMTMNPIKTEHFKWDLQFNFSKYRRYLESLYKGRKRSDNYVMIGERTDQLYTTVYQTDGKGNVVFEKGFPVTDPFPRFIGYSEPNYTYGISNNFSYYNFNLNILFDGKVGGYLFSRTNQKMWWGGTALGTVNSFRDDANEGKSTYIANGVKVIGGTIQYDSNGNIISDTRQFAPNDVPVNYIDFMQTTSNYHNKNYHFYKQTYIKLRELTLTYNFPNQLLEKLPFTKASLSLVGRNLWILSEIENVDPDSGKDELQTPSMRSIGINVNLNF